MLQDQPIAIDITVKYGMTDIERVISYTGYITVYSVYYLYITYVETKNFLNATD